MQTIYTPIEIQVDDEASDDGFYDVFFRFSFDAKTTPRYVCLCRNALEAPD